ncbi:hypothetical protein J6590_039933 [Homalodisca vitripennis]|nr:hypothetical protein J6590_039933 [Homalodisca vitripennis]
MNSSDSVVRGVGFGVGEEINSPSSPHRYCVDVLTGRGLLYFAEGMTSTLQRRKHFFVNVSECNEYLKRVLSVIRYQGSHKNGKDYDVGCRTHILRGAQLAIHYNFDQIHMAFHNLKPDFEATHVSLKESENSFFAEALLRSAGCLVSAVIKGVFPLNV